MRVQAYLAVTATDGFPISEPQQRTPDTATVIIRVDGDVIEKKVVCFAYEDQQPCNPAAKVLDPRGVVPYVPGIIVQHWPGRFADPRDVHAIRV